MDNTSIKNNIRKIRKARKLTQEEMAHKLGISLTAYKDFEKGNTSILNSTLHKVASCLDTPAEEIVLGYIPTQTEGKPLKEIHEEYAFKIKILERQIADLEKIITIQEESIANKNDIIQLLKNRLEEKGL